MFELLGVQALEILFYLISRQNSWRHLDVDVVMRFSGIRKPARLNRSLIICPLMLRSS